MSINSFIFAKKLQGNGPEMVYFLLQNLHLLRIIIIINSFVQKDGDMNEEDEH